MATADLTTRIEPRRAYWSLFAVVLAYEFVCGIDMGQTSVLVKPIEQFYGIGDTEFAAIAVSAFFAGQIFVYYIGGVLADAYNRRNLLLASCALWTLAAAAVIFAAHPWQLFTARFVGGFAMSIGGASIFHLLVDSFSRDRRMLAMTLFGVGYSLGIGAGISLSGAIFHLAEQFGTQQWPLAGRVVPWQLCFLFIAGLGVTSGALLLTVREPTRMDARPGETKRSALSSLRIFAWYMRRHGWLWLLFLSSNYVALSVTNSITAFEPTLANRVYHVPVASAAALLGAITAAMQIGSRVLGGAIVQILINRGKSDMVPRVIPYFTGAAVLWTLAFPLVPSYAASVVLMSLNMLLLNTLPVFQVAAIQDTAPNEVRGQVVGLLGFFNFISYAIGTILVAFVSDRFFGGGAGLRFSFAIIGVVSVALGTVGLCFSIAPYLAARRDLESTSGVDALLPRIGLETMLRTE